MLCCSMALSCNACRIKAFKNSQPCGERIWKQVFQWWEQMQSLLVQSFSCLSSSRWVTRCCPWELCSWIRGKDEPWWLKTWSSSKTQEWYAWRALSETNSNWIVYERAAVPKSCTALLKIYFYNMLFIFQRIIKLPQRLTQSVVKFFSCGLIALQNTISYIWPSVKTAVTKRINLNCRCVNESLWRA